MSAESTDATAGWGVWDDVALGSTVALAGVVLTGAFTGPSPALGTIAGVASVGAGLATVYWLRTHAGPRDPSALWRCVGVFLLLAIGPPFVLGLATDPTLATQRGSVVASVVLGAAAGSWCYRRWAT